MDKPRYRHNPDAELQGIIQRLDMWGAYIYKNVIGLGYPSMSAERRAFEGGSGGGKGVAFVPIYWRDKFNSNTDAAIKDLSEDYRKVIFAKFALPHSPHVAGKWTSQLAVDYCGMTETTFKRKCAIAVSHLAGKFGYSI